MQAFNVDHAAPPSDVSPAPEATTSVRRRWLGDVLVLSPQGSLDALVARELARAVDDALAAVVIDLNDCIVIDPRVFDLLEPVSTSLPPGRICIACRRLSARRMLALSRTFHHVMTFQRIEDALRARILETNGMGPGWTPAR